MSDSPNTQVASINQDWTERDKTIDRFIRLVAEFDMAEYLRAIMLVHRLGGLTDAEVLSLMEGWGDE